MDAPGLCEPFMCFGENGLKLGTLLKVHAEGSRELLGLLLIAFSVFVNSQSKQLINHLHANAFELVFYRILKTWVPVMGEVLHKSNPGVKQCQHTL